MGVHRIASLIVLFALAGCSADLPAGEAGEVAVRFAQSAPEASCALLAPQTLANFETDNGPCAAALAELHLSTDAQPVAVEVAGESAQVRLPGQVVFLARFSDGWRVTAAGCQRTDADTAVPYDCEVEP